MKEKTLSEVIVAIDEASSDISMGLSDLGTSLEGVLDDILKELKAINRNLTKR